MHLGDSTLAVPDTPSGCRQAGPAGQGAVRDMLVLRRALCTEFFVSRNLCGNFNRINGFHSAGMKLGRGREGEPASEKEDGKAFVSCYICNGL
jgi:hypothetical protein